MRRERSPGGTYMPRDRPTYTVTVCAACYRASCWQGVSRCDEYMPTDTVQATRMELSVLALESRRFWKVMNPAP